MSNLQPRQTVTGRPRLAALSFRLGDYTTKCIRKHYGVTQDRFSRRRCRLQLQRGCPTSYLLPSIEALDLRLLTYIEQQCIRHLRMDMSKDLVAASATPLVLAILAEGDSYGYAIIKRVAELSGGHLQWADGMLYPVLHRLERQGHVAAKWSASESGRRRKYYRITREGRAQLAAQRQQWQAVDGTLRGIWMKGCTA